MFTTNVPGAWTVTSNRTRPRAAARTPLARRVRHLHAACVVRLPGLRGLATGPEHGQRAGAAGGLQLDPAQAARAQVVSSLHRHRVEGDQGLVRLQEAARQADAGRIGARLGGNLSLPLPFPGDLAFAFSLAATLAAALAAALALAFTLAGFP